LIDELPAFAFATSRQLPLIFRSLMLQENSRFCIGARTFAELMGEQPENRCCCSGYTG
jgi:hypothetical protein